MASTTKSAARWPKTELAAAVALGVDRTTLQKYLARGAPKKTRRGFDIDAIRAWRAANIAPVARAPRLAGDDETLEVSDRARLLKAQADEREAKALHAALKHQIDRGDFIPREEVKENNLALISILKRGVTSLPRTVAPRLVGLTEKEIGATLTRFVRELLDRLSRMCS